MSASRTARERAKRREKRAGRRRRRALATSLGFEGPGQATPSGLPKMSDVLVAFARPILDTLDDDASVDDYRGVLRTAAAVWNILAMFDEESRRGGGVLVDQARTIELTKLLAEAVGGLDDESIAIIDALRERRRALFPDERRIVMDVGADLRGERVHVFAASAPL
jgi:hypothetical protein